jgi:orotate phosphoribosyltransferase
MSLTLRGSTVVRSLVADYAYTRRPEPFTLSSGARSFDYIDAKKILLVNEFQAQIGAEMAKAIGEREYVAVGGLELGAIYVAEALLTHMWAVERRVTRSFVVRKKEKRHGKGLRIEGPSVEDQPVIVVDDVVTTGDSILHAVAAVRDQGAHVVQAITLVDRGDIASARLAELGIPYHALTTYRDYGIEPILEEELPPPDQAVTDLKQLQLTSLQRLRELTSWSWDESDNTGDARYAGIAKLLEILADAWDGKTGLSDDVLQHLNRVLADNLADIVNSPDAAWASQRTRAIRDDVAIYLG